MKNNSNLISLLLCATGVAFSLSAFYLNNENNKTAYDKYMNLKEIHEEQVRRVAALDYHVFNVNNERLKDKNGNTEFFAMKDVMGILQITPKAGTDAAAE